MIYNTVYIIMMINGIIYTSGKVNMDRFLGYNVIFKKILSALKQIQQNFCVHILTLSIVEK